MFGDGTERAARLVEAQHEHPVILVGEMPPEEFLYVPHQHVAPGKHLFPFLRLFPVVRFSQRDEILVTGAGVTAVVPRSGLHHFPVTAEKVGFPVLYPFP